MNFVNLFYLVIFLAFGAQATDFNVIDGTKLIDQSDDETGLSTKTLTKLEENPYVEPNEINPNFFAEKLIHSKGTLISVGTFRSLIIFTLGQFDRLIMVDVAKPILSFNRKHLRFIDGLAKKYPENPAQQRIEYATEYQKYLHFFRPSNVSYYWEDDGKWQKIVTALQDNKIHVLRGNFSNDESNQAFLDVVKKLDTTLTIDLSNMAQYADDYNKFNNLIRKFGAISNGPMAILATNQKFTDQKIFGNHPYSVGFDTTRKDEESPMWIYLYFPLYEKYLEYVHAVYELNKSSYNLVRYNLK